ncbi:hypothetical protein [Bacillus cereus]|uniref:Uncharacterized protein n=1 Tax=Bacillus cereus TaxID=1396 RepID=A0AA44Q5P9_BACCE|nr:hypothetical protein [Bacillus cereus]PFN04668.1 hypothetical protein COJ55_20825 [Bacillus cereus]PFR87697.1 hypothetical protein COK38_25915 [Bacillus cereus]
MNNRRLEFDYKTASCADLGHGLKRYYWMKEIQIVGNEYLDIQLAVQENQAVIGTGFSTHPLQNIYGVGTRPIYQFIMIISLYNAEAANVETKVLLNVWAMAIEWSER